MSNGQVEQHVLRSRVEHYLQLYLYDNAVFLCERLHAEYPHEDNLNLLAKCYYRSGHPNRAFTILQGTRMAHNRYIFALCCFELGKLQEAETALLQGTKIRGQGPAKCREQILEEPCPVPFGAAGLHLLGRICKRANRRQQAIEYFELSLHLDPFLWSSYEELCSLGANLAAASFFKGSNPDGAPESGGSRTPNMALFNTPSDIGNVSGTGTPMEGLEDLSQLNQSAQQTPMQPKPPASLVKPSSGLGTCTTLCQFKFTRSCARPNLR
jgi:tetratricopeptide (TPR) repeat protein